ncbi:MAG: hypothetical protein ACJA1B_001906 [Polaribacter sp.]|jgi:hypothetical protein
MGIKSMSYQELKNDKWYPIIFLLGFFNFANNFIKKKIDARHQHKNNR